MIDQMDFIDGMYSIDQSKIFNAPTPRCTKDFSPENETSEESRSAEFSVFLKSLIRHRPDGSLGYFVLFVKVSLLFFQQVTAATLNGEIMTGVQVVASSGNHFAPESSSPVPPGQGTPIHSNSPHPHVSDR